MSETQISDEERAARRYQLMTMVRIGSIAAVIAGLAIAREILPLPYALGVIMSVVGLVAFFFGPPVLAKRWKAADRLESGEDGA